MQQSVQALCEELVAIQHALADDVLDYLPQMVERYHLNLEAWMVDGIGHDLSPVSQLRTLHWQTIAQLQRRQHHLYAQMQIERNGERAARAYLSGYRT